MRGAANMAHREFTDREGQRWEVWEVQPSISTDGVSAPGLLLGEDAARGWLAFQSARERRRFYMPPEGWESFSEEQLSILCHHAVPVPPAR